jgi:hypothetical protein
MKKTTLVALAAMAAFSVRGQVAITNDGTAPHSSAMLHIKSTNKGVVLSRMNSSQRGNIPSPTDGLMVYDTDTKSFWYFQSGGGGWTEIGSGGLSLPLVETGNDAGTLFSIANDGDGTSVQGISNSTSASIAAVRGIVSNAAPGGFSSAVRGINSGTGGLGIGMWGSHDGSGWGVYGVTPSGLGVYGNSSGSGYGIYGNSNNGTGSFATSTNGKAFEATILNTGNYNDVVTVSNQAIGTGINVTTVNKGVVATTVQDFPFQGITSYQSTAAVYGNNNPGEVIVGINNNNLAGAVVGRNNGGGYGVRGFVAGNTDGTGVGVLGQAGATGGTGHAARFENTNSGNPEDVVEVTSGGNGNGIFVDILGSSANAAVNGQSSASNGNGVIGRADGAGAYGVWGKSSNGYAGYFNNKVHVSGVLSKSSGTFKIDHPQDPENKYLIHSFVESPDMMNVYNGNITTDANGVAMVSLPSYFEAENIDFKYQLTVVGQFAQAIIGKEVAGNQFEIQTDKPNVKVSWQVTGVRNDKFAQQHRVVAEEEKAPNEKGYYLNAKEYGQPETRSMEYAHGKMAAPRPKKELTAAQLAAQTKLASAQPVQAMPARPATRAMPPMQEEPAAAPEKKN